MKSRNLSVHLKKIFKHSIISEDYLNLMAKWRRSRKKEPLKKEL